jgi:hypothetical protein
VGGLLGSEAECFFDEPFHIEPSKSFWLCPFLEILTC